MPNLDSSINIDVYKKVKILSISEIKDIENIKNKKMKKYINNVIKTKQQLNNNQN